MSAIFQIVISFCFYIIFGCILGSCHKQLCVTHITVRLERSLVKPNMSTNKGFMVVFSIVKPRHPNNTLTCAMKNNSLFEI